MQPLQDETSFHSLWAGIAFLPRKTVEMWVSVLIEVPSTFVELALSLQNVFPNHLLGSGYSGLSRLDLPGGRLGLQRCSFQIQSDMHDFWSQPQQARTSSGRVTGPEVLRLAGSKVS